ncbi:MAG: hypothetical protein ACRCZF_14805, partial [Gemmataceae bacterium]
ATSLPTLSTVNPNGNGIDYTTISPANAVYLQTSGVVIYTSNAFILYAKRWLSNNILRAFGGLSTMFVENTPARLTSLFSGISLVQIDAAQGWIVATSATVGQRGLFFMDIRSDDIFDYSYIVTKVLDTQRLQFFEFINTIEEIFDETNPMVFSYRTAATSNDPIFATASGGWTPIAFAKSLRPSLLSNYTQVRIGFDIAQFGVQTSSQVSELYLIVTGRNEISENWAGSGDNSTDLAVSPAKSAFRLQKAYPTVVPTLFFRAYDDNGNLVANANTAANSSLFEYSTNNGTTWQPLGVIPNTALSTEVRYNWPSPPGVAVTSSIRES